MSCIYYLEDLPCNSREHVFPAALGGRTMLPIGYVSDEANASFSKIELEVFRSSFIAINRRNLGPGKRGSLRMQDSTNPQMLIMQDFDISGDNYKIGFVFRGLTYIIPQIVIDIDDESSSWIPYFASNISQDDAFKSSCSFQRDLVSFLEDPQRNFSFINMPFVTDKHFIAIGQYNNKWYAATSHKFINMDLFSATFLDDIKDINWVQNAPISTKKNIHHYEWHFKVNTSNERFVLLKIAFNTCALFITAEEISKSSFDNVRQTLVGDSTRPIKYDFCKYSVLDKFNIGSLPAKCHLCVLQSDAYGVEAYVSLYSEATIFRITLSESPIEKRFVKALVCDWQNRNEFTWQPE